VKAKRIVLLGCAGGGKTTLARDLGLATGYPVLVLDEILPAFNSDTAAFRGALARAHAADTWISDGNFAIATFDLRLPRADLIVWLDRPRWQCLLRAMLRVTRRDAFHRPGKLGEVVRFIWNFDRVNRPRIEKARLAHGPKVPIVHLRSDRQIGAFLDSFTQA
jgi:adenylate kinase family enzyme